MLLLLCLVCGTGDDQDVILRMRDPLKVLEALLAHPQLKGGRLTTLAQPQYTSVGEQAERAYCHPMDCDKAVQLQLRVGDHVVVLMLQFYSDKTRLVSSASGASAWPFILTILNVSDHDKQVSGRAASCKACTQTPPWQQDQHTSTSACQQ